MNIVAKGYRGSKIYGLDVDQALSKQTGYPVSDDDGWEVYMPTRQQLLGIPLQSGLPTTRKGESHSYPFSKFVKMCGDANPNILELLYLRLEDYIDVHPIFKELVFSRDLFMTKQVGHTYKGYATTQYETMLTKQNNQSGRQYLVEKFGLDTKFISHSIRVLRQGKEALQTGTLHVYRYQDREDLLNIKVGKDIDNWKELYDYELVLFDDARKKSRLPEEPDWNKINDLCVELQEKYLYGRSFNE